MSANGLSMDNEQSSSSQNSSKTEIEHMDDDQCEEQKSPPE